MLDLCEQESKSGCVDIVSLQKNRQEYNERYDHYFKKRYLKRYQRLKRRRGNGWKRNY